MGAFPPPPLLRGSRHWGGGGSGGAVVKQVTKSNFAEALQQIKGHIHDADFVTVSSQKTGSAFPSSAPASSSGRRHWWWQRVSPIDTAETAYLKAKLAAERFELLQFAVCPFRLEGSKVVAFPYNFHLFPRDELNIGMPSYSFSCQTSFLTSMAREGFDFNVCIYNGISYLSRVQESMAKDQSPIPSIGPITSSQGWSVADAIFMERIKSRVQHWRSACKSSCKTTEEALVKSLRKLISGGNVYGSRSCINIDVCSNRQVQLVMQVLRQMSDDLVPLIIPDKGGELKVVRAVLTSSEEDKNLLLSELQNLEEEHNRKVRGFREVIDVMSSSHKPIIAYNGLNDFTFIHSKFLSPLPPSMAEFMCSLQLVFSNILDVDHLLKEIGPLRKASNLPAAISYLKRQFFVPLDMEIPQAEESICKNHGHNVLRITNLFARLSLILKIDPASCQNKAGEGATEIKNYANIFHPCCTGLQEPGDEDVTVWMDSVRKVNIANIVFLWGFRDVISDGQLKRRLYRTHDAFSEDFELRLLDKSCAVVVFWKPGFAEALLEDMGSGNIHSGALSEMISEGLKAANYEAYKRVCMLGLWETELADSLGKSLSETANNPYTDVGHDSSEIYWDNESMIDLNDL